MIPERRWFRARCAFAVAAAAADRQPVRGATPARRAVVPAEDAQHYYRWKKLAVAAVGVAVAAAEVAAGVVATAGGTGVRRGLAVVVELLLVGQRRDLRRGGPASVGAGAAVGRLLSMMRCCCRNVRVQQQRPWSYRLLLKPQPECERANRSERELVPDAATVPGFAAAAAAAVGAAAIVVPPAAGADDCVVPVVGLVVRLAAAAAADSGAAATPASVPRPGGAAVPRPWRLLPRCSKGRRRAALAAAAQRPRTIPEVARAAGSSHPSAAAAAAEAVDGAAHWRAVPG